ncbi:hypothetical protein SmJEL517_g04018 [Synchytrium microbalum]|uniref:Ubiquitin carboxyl-terminal hydrolase n=1 Tax=Synchytrium microbalum TaxID=1806994 RepID=A0A507C1N8_9FUNG|nr:uncharacterized protein SmJEL517_g04018 [Synchytrium microbalum]TPX32979.1 hypothetical protein SmJEL517_g04018 [Synchytrium microbalum]
MSNSSQKLQEGLVRAPSPSIHLLHPRNLPESSGCMHIAAAKAGANTTSSDNSVDLVDAYKTCVRYAISYHARYQIASNRPNRPDPAKIESAGLISPTLNNTQSGGTGVKRKRDADIERDLVSIDKVLLTHAVARGAAVVEFGLYTRHLSTISMDFSNCTVYCRACNDYVYDADFERTLNAEKTRLDLLLTQVKEPTAKRIRYGEWTAPPPDQVAKIRNSAQLQRCSGIRGLRNLGSSCYMSVILQALIHNPLLRAHFLSSKHSQATCSLSPCIACEMDHLFTEFNKGDTQCFSPASFMLATWQTAKSLAGNMHQDAHEFYIATLNQIHSNCSGTVETSIGDTSECKCIVHQVFSGLLLSEVTCQTCGNVTHKPDEFLDLSLDLITPRQKAKNKNTLGLEGLVNHRAKYAGTQIMSPPPSAPSSTPSSTSSLLESGGSDVCTLSECLDRYTMPEKLGATEYHCIKCSTFSANATKQLSLKRLPPVLTVQLKRFEQSQAQSVKIETPVRIPAELDMTPYSTRAVKANEAFRKASNLPSPNGTPTPKILLKESVPAFRYVLFAVVNHEGKLETGHYTSYNKIRGMWFKFDDANVTSATQKEVLESKAYMCFYIRQSYEFSPTSAVEIPSRTSPPTNNRLQSFSSLHQPSPPPPLVYSDPSTERGGVSL